jgi:hypothetical protein
VTTSLSGQGVEASTLSAPSSVNFISQKVGAPGSGSQQTLLISNSGTSPQSVILGVLSGANASDFTLIYSNCSEAIAGGSSCAVIYAFSPSAIGTRTATLAIHNVSADVDMHVTRTGQGISP